MSDLDFWGEQPSQKEPRRERSAKVKKQKTKKKRGGGAAVLALLFLLAVVGGGGFFGYQKLKNYMQPGDYTGEGTGSATIEVKDGDFTSNIAATLQKADVVKSTKAFIQVADKEPKAKGIQPGFYKMRLQMSSAAALKLLLDPKSRAGIVNVPEGMWASEVFALLSKQTKIPVREFEKVRKNPRALGLPAAAKGNLEGYLFPAQYNLQPKANAAQLLKMMVDRFKTEIATLSPSISVQAKKTGRTPGEIITIASLIQAEAGKPKDYGQISRVIYNRLKAPMPLQFDTAILYAWKKKTLDVRNRHLEIVSPYNLYDHQGLPPGPISNPGLGAIKAALNPTPGPWMYFVATDPTNKVTKFGVTSDDFKRLKAEFEKWLAENPQP